MKRVFYITLGATVGVLVVRRVGEFAQRWTPEGLAAQAGGIGERAAVWWAAVQEAAAEREAELRHGLGIDAASHDEDVA